MAQNLPPSMSPDGESSHLLNLRCRDGVWRPVGRPTRLYEPADPTHRLIYVHVNESYKHFFTYDGSRLYYEAEEREGAVWPVPGQPGFEITGVQRVESVGKTLIVFTDGAINYLLYAEGGYKWLGSLPDIPQISFRVGDEKTESAKWNDYALGTKIKEKDLSQFSESDKSNFSSIVFGAYNLAKNTLLEDGRISYPVLVRYALRLYDDSYIYPSPPVLLTLSDRRPFDEIIGTGCKEKDNEISMLYQGEITVKGGKVFYTVQEADLSDWGDIIKGVDIFFSRELTAVKENNSLENYSFADSGSEHNIPLLKFSLPVISEKEQRESILNETLFYKVASLDIDSVVADPGVSVPLEYDCLLTNTEHQRLLSLDNFSLHKMQARESYVYNGRLHLANITTRYFDGYPLPLFATAQSRYHGVKTEPVAIASGRVLVTLKTSAGLSRMLTPIPKGSYALSAYISYPDSRAVSMKIYGYDASGRPVCQMAVPLKASPNENMACYLSEGLQPVALKVDDSLPAEIPPAGNTTEHTPGKVRVSGAYNPFRFPQENTYTLPGTVLGLAAATAALSQGQYGEFPLYIFTSDGIWVLQQGSGEVLYANQHPVNREVALSPRHIVSVDDAVLYLSVQGLMALQGAEASLLSAPFEGCPDSLPADTCDDPTADAVAFKSFVGDAAVGYNYTEKELLFLNAAYPYMWVFDLASLQWSKRTAPCVRFLSLYPSLLAIDGNANIYNVSAETTVGDVDVAWVSRAVKIVPDMPKRLPSCTIRATGRASLAVSLWASNRAEEGYCAVYRVRVDGVLPGHIALRPATPAYKNYRLSVRGRVSPDFHLDAVDVAFCPTPGKFT